MPSIFQGPSFSTPGTSQRINPASMDKILYQLWILIYTSYLCKQKFEKNLNSFLPKLKLIVQVSQEKQNQKKIFLEEIS